MLASSPVKARYLWWTIILLLQLTVTVCAQGCDSGWFGSSCQYKCHCINNNCDNSGDCTGTNTCVKGWFGPQCQYVDLTYTQSTTSTPVWLRDGDDTTCNDDPHSQTATVFLQRSFPFTWCRIHLNDANLLESINVEFRGTSGGATISCNEKKNSTVDSLTIDIYCDLNVEIQEVVVTGIGVRNLCSFSVSGGRNVALKQEATQSSTYNYTYPGGDVVYGLASHAVDGDTNQNFQAGSCTHTEPSDYPNWNVTFSHSSKVNRYVLYNRQDQAPERLNGFILTSLANNVDLQVFEYHDPGLTVQSVYTITSVTNTSPITRVNIRHSTTSSILTLCEVEVYGDSVCSLGKYGKECENDCNCAVDEQCFVSTGGCPNGCTAGFMGERCHLLCPDHSYGINCRHRCSENCVQRECDASSGRCNNCFAGFDGDFCNEKCPDTRHGPRCTESCSSDCLDSKCNGTSGNCIRCPPGYLGDLCKEVCPNGFWGDGCNGVCGNCKNDVDCKPEDGTCPSGCSDGYTGNLCDAQCEYGRFGTDCREICSIHCNTTDLPEGQTPCHHVDGSCLSGCNIGYEGKQCFVDVNAQDSRANTETAVGIGAAIGSAVTVVIGIIIVGVYCYWRRSSAQRSRRERPPNYDTVDSTSDMHTYSDLFKSADGYDLPTDLTPGTMAVKTLPDNPSHYYSSANEVPYENMDGINLSRLEEDQHPNTGRNNEGYIDC